MYIPKQHRRFRRCIPEDGFRLDLHRVRDLGHYRQLFLAHSGHSLLERQHTRLANHSKRVWVHRTVLDLIYTCVLVQVVDALHLSRRTFSKIRQNLGWAFAYNAIALPLAAGALLPGFGIALTPSVSGAERQHRFVFAVTLVICTLLCGAFGGVCNLLVTKECSCRCTNGMQLACSHGKFIAPPERLSNTTSTEWIEQEES